jgi:uncharacterized integral membrane protein
MLQSVIMADEAQRPERRLQPRGVAVALLVAAAALFAVLNLDEVKVNWVVTTTHTPLVVVIVLLLAIGLGIGWIAGRRRHKD